MYYLNDQHPEFEYALYCKINNGCPYISNVYDNKQVLEITLGLIEKNNNRYHYIFYIDYPGYKNKYPKELAKRFYKVLKRPVMDWQEIA